MDRMATVHFTDVDGDQFTHRVRSTVIAACSCDAVHFRYLCRMNVQTENLNVNVWVCCL